jgi:hypothetical protein
MSGSLLSLTLSPQGERRKYRTIFLAIDVYLVNVYARKLP